MLCDVITHRIAFTRPASSAGSGATTMLVFDGIRMGAMIELNGKFLGNASNQFQRYVFKLGADAFVQQSSVPQSSTPRTNAAGSHTLGGAPPSAATMDTTTTATTTNTLKITFGAELGIPLGGRNTFANQIDWAPTMLTYDKTTCDTHYCRSTFGFGIWKSVCSGVGRTCGVGGREECEECEGVRM